MVACLTVLAGFKLLRSHDLEKWLHGVQELRGVRSACEVLEQTVAHLEQKVKAEEAKQGEMAGREHCMLGVLGMLTTI